MTENKMVSAKRFDEHLRKVACPQCRARLFDINPDNWDYKAIVMRMGGRTSFDIAEKCPKCKALVGISLERKQAQLKFRTVSNQPPVGVRSLSLPMPCRVVLLEEGAGA